MAIEERFIQVMQDQGASSERLAGLIRIGPVLVGQGYSEDEVYFALLRLIREGKIVHDDNRNGVKFPRPMPL